MFELPLFPLNTVLFPGMPLKLHIFEERYKQMINRCIDEQKPFGVLLIESGEEALGPLAEPYLVGTTAQITQIQRLPFGRMNLLAVGRERFKVQQFKYDHEYLCADVEILAYASESDPDIEQFGKPLRPLVEHYLSILEKAGQIQLESHQLPQDITSLAHFAAVILQTENTHKQNMLEQDKLTAYLADLAKAYKREVALLEVLIQPPEGEQASDAPFSYN